MLVADRLHSAAIHLLRMAAKQDVLSNQGPARLLALSVLVFAGPKTLGELAAAERVKPPTMSRIVAGLKRSGLVKTAGDNEDARRIRITVTQKGEKILQEARRRRIQSLANAISNFTDAQLESLWRSAELVEEAIRSSRN
jgi:DNA-binding MarR family transcriptional regulator